MAEVLVRIVLLVACSSIFEPDKHLKFLELFAGKARLTRLARSLHIAAEAHDIEFDVGPKRGSKSAMDLTTDAGFLSLDVHTSRTRHLMLKGVWRTVQRRKQ